MINLRNLLFLILSLVTFSCTFDEQFKEFSNINESTKVTAILPDWSLDDGKSRTSITTGSYPTAPSPVWVTGDSIGIYPDAGGDQLSFRINEGGSKTCSFDGGGWAMKSSSYTAYSPFKRSFYYEDKDALPISMLGQTQTGNDNADHLGAYDIQIAKGNKPEAGSLVFQFNRYVALARLEITAPKAATWTSVTLESNALFTTEAKMNLDLETPTVTPVKTSNSMTLKLTNVTTTNDNLSIIAYMMLLPVDLTGKTLFVKLTDSDSNVYTSNGTITNNKTNFAANSARWITANEFPTEIDNTPYLTFTADTEQTLTMSKAVATLEYSVKEGEWKELGTKIVTFGGDNGDLRLRGKSSIGTCGDNLNYSYICFGNDVEVSCTGDIRTLIDYENYESTNTSYARFCFLFRDCSQLKTAPELPITALAKNCYYDMFYNCTSLTAAPQLPATTLTTECYFGMFSGCSSLTTVPKLPATTLKYGCYNQMFRGCTSLTTAPKLPATTLDSDCYYGMFKDCTSLTTAPELPAMTLAKYCYQAMFSGCTSLIIAPKLPATTLATECYLSMFRNCTSLTTAPEELPATTLTNSCYRYMFSGCTSLTTAPKLPATTLLDYCYVEMFYNCSKLSSITMLATNIQAQAAYSLCLENWLYGVSATGTFIKNKEIESSYFYKGAHGIPKEWVVKDYNVE